MKRLRAWLDRLGVAGVLGLGLLISSALFYFKAITPAGRALEVQRGAAQRHQARSAYQPVSVDQRADRLGQFRNLFPPTETLPQQLEQLYALAQTAKLELRQGEYRLDRREPQLNAYRITLPVRGTYSELRNFLSAVLMEMPIASIDALRFERKKASEAQLEAQIRLTIYFRPPDAPQ